MTMLHYLTMTLLALGLLCGICAAEEQSETKTEVSQTTDSIEITTDEEKVNYSLGFELGQDLVVDNDRAVAVVGVLVPEFVAVFGGKGDEAPAFELPGSDGKTYKLSDFADKKVVVVAWFPKAFTGG